MWMVRNNGGEYADEFVGQKIVAVGWQDAGPLNELLKSRDQIIDRVKEIWPDWKPLKAVVSGSQLNKIVNVMEVGDRVITYDPSKRIYYVGRIAENMSLTPMPTTFWPIAAASIGKDR